MQEQVKDKFGDKALDFALFYNHERSLRFELSSNQHSYIEMFLRAYDRAKSLVDFVFRDTEKVSICLAFFGSGRFLSHLSIFRALKECEIAIPKKHFAWQKCYVEEDEYYLKFYGEKYQYYRTCICFDIAKTEISKFLWGTLANELGIRPRSQCDLYLFDF